MVAMRAITGVALPLALCLFSRVSAETYAYIGNAESNNVSVFRSEPSGARWIAVETTALPVEKPGNTTPLALSPDHHRLYAASRAEPFAVISFAIDPANGHLTSLGTAPLAASMANIATDRSGKFLFSASYGGNEVAVNAIGADGVVGPVLQVVPTGLKAHSIQPSPDNHYVFASNLGSDQILSFHFDGQTGYLTPADPAMITLPAQSGPRHFQFSPDRRFVYLIDETDCLIRVFAYDAANGHWSPRQEITSLPDSFTGRPWAADLHITPDGRFLYATERTSSTLSAFRIDPASGQLSLIERIPTETQPRGFNIDASGRLLAAVGELSSRMTVYLIDQTSGKLHETQSYAVGKSPNWVEFVTFP